MWGIHPSHGPGDLTAADVIARVQEGNHWPEPASLFLRNCEGRPQTTDEGAV